MKIQWITLISIITYSLSAQQVGRLEVNNVRLDVACNGNIGMGMNASGMEYPINSGIHALFAGNLWIAGFDSTFGNLHVSANGYNESTTNFVPGPIASNYSGQFHVKYDRVWKISKAEIDNHIQHYNDAGYIIPQRILEWPANGNTQNGEADILAPYYDRDNNRLYEPDLGDYPIIRGDEALYVIYNDEQNQPQKTDGLPFRAEIHLMVYAFNSPAQSHLHNTIFLHYRLINRSSEIYRDVMVAHWNDFDLGCFSNDRVGTDTNLNCIFVYNGSSTDNPCNGVSGYGSSQVSLSLSLLNRNLYSSAYFTNGSVPFMADPGGNPMQIYNYMNGLWLDGTPFTLGGNGYGGNTPTRFMFPGSPCDSADASEVYAINAGDRRAMATTDKRIWLPSEEICIDWAYTFATENSTGICSFDEVNVLKSEVQKVKNTYDLNLNYCDGFSLGGYTNNFFDNQVNVRYSAATKVIDISGLNANEALSLVLINAQGQCLKTFQCNDDECLLSLHDYSTGIYLLQIKNGSNQKSIKLMIY